MRRLDFGTVRSHLKHAFEKEMHAPPASADGATARLCRSTTAAPPGGGMIAIIGEAARSM
jgi:hypothetical protein